MGVFNDTFDVYAAQADLLLGWWDGGTSAGTLATGRFTGSRAVTVANTTMAPFKNSGGTDATHHILFAVNMTSTFTGTTLGAAITLGDGATAQCSIVLRSDGAILLTSGGPGGTVLATYTGAFSASNVWNAFEFEVTINNTTGSFKVRKNGNTSDDFSATGLNTRGGTANNYATRMTLTAGSNTPTFLVDDLRWEYGATAGVWRGDLRGYARMPAADASVQFSRPGTVTQSAPSGTLSTSTIVASTARYTPYVASYSGSIASLSINLALGYTGGLKCALFAAGVGVPGTLIQAATAAITNPVTGINTFSFSPAVAITRGATYWVGFCGDTAVTSGWNTNGSAVGVSGTGPVYASWPASNPSGIVSAVNVITGSIAITTSLNAECVNEAQQDSTASYVFDSTVSHGDLYSIASIGVTPITVVDVTTRAMVAKSDAGARSAAVQIKSGATTVQSAARSLTTSFGWVGRIDSTDPNTGAAWTASAVNALQAGPVVTA